MDKLYESAKYYAENLEGKKFHLTAGKKGRLLEMDIVFDARNYKHLVGLQKLTDIPVMKYKSDVIYQRILNKQITFETISRSEFLNEMEDRLDVFNRIRDTLFTPTTLRQSSRGEFKTIKADFLLSKSDENAGNLHLFLKGDKEGLTIPVTFFARQDTSYLTTDSASWKVLSVEEVAKQSANPDNDPLKKALKAGSGRDPSTLPKGAGTSKPAPAAPNGGKVNKNTKKNAPKKGGFWGL